MDVPDATGRTGVSALDPSPLFLPSSPDLSPTISYIYICTYTYVCVCVLRMDTGRSRKGCKAWRRLTLSKLLYRRHIRTCPVFSGRRECTWLLGQRASKDVPAESNTGNWVNSRNARCSKLGFERIIGMMKRISEKN